MTQIPPLSDLPPNDSGRETCKVALFGGHNTGKTLQIRSLIEMYGAANVGIVSCENGLGTIESSLAGVGKREPKNLREFKDAWKWAQDTFNGRDKWVCVDGGTRAIQWGANEIIQGTDAAFIELASGKYRNQVSDQLKQYLRFITNDGNIDGRKLWPSIAWDTDYEMSRWVGLNCNHYWTFWDDGSWVNDKKGLPWQIDAPGDGSRRSIYGTFDFIFRLTREGEKVVAEHDPTGKSVRSKTRDDWSIHKVPLKQDDFNLATFSQSIKPRHAEAAK